MVAPAAPRDPRAKRWERRLAGAAELQLPSDYPRPGASAATTTTTATSTAGGRSRSHSRAGSAGGEGPGGAVARAGTVVQAECTRALAPSAILADAFTPTPASGGCPATPYHVVVAAFVVLLARHTGQHDVVVGSSARAAPGAPLALLRLAVHEEMTLSQLLGHVAEVCCRWSSPLLGLAALLSRTPPDLADMQPRP
jgi:hypothetical protein